ncbi:MAG: OsmC family protein [Candidatus Thorarchaeota archaeon]
MKEEVPPKYYPVRLVWTGGKSGSLTVEGKAEIKTGVPSGGPDEAIFHSPEDLFVASAAICYMNGFVEFTKKMRIEFKSFECDAVGTLEKVGRSFEVTKIEMTTKVSISSDDIRKKFERALELAAKYCFIGASMRCPITHDTEVIVVGD